MEKNISHIVVAACMANMLTGCGIYTKYRQPETNTDGLFGALPEEVDTTSSLADLKWEELFTDASLRKLITRALEANTDLNVARLKVEEARASLSAAKQAYLPSAQLDPEGALSSFDGSKPTKTYSLGASASWELDFFGKLTNAKRGERAALEQSEAYRQVLQTQLIATVAESYYTLLMLDGQYEVTEQTAVKWRESVRTMRAMKEAGMANEAAVAQYEGTCLSIEASLHDLQYQIRMAENSLCTLLAEGPHQIERGRLEGQRLPDDLTVGVPVQMLSNRPDIRSAEYSLMQSYYATSEARSALYPTITLSGTLGWTNNSGIRLENPGKILWSAAASLLQPIFNANANRARVKIAKAQQEETKLAFQQALLNAGAEVNNALTQCQSARAKADLRVQQIEALERAVESTELLMKHSSTTYLEVLTAQQSLLSAQLSQIADRFDEIQGVVNLYQALGGGRDMAEEAK